MDDNYKPCSKEQFVEFVSIVVLERKITHPIEKDIVKSFFDKTYKNIATDNNYKETTVKERGQNLMKEIRKKTGREKLHKTKTKAFIIELYLESCKNKQVHLKNDRTTLVASELDLLYGQLEHFLQLEKWKLADIKTNQILLTLADAKKNGYLDGKSVLKIPWEDLQKIDRLWRVHSNNDYGYSVQAKIWIEKGNRPNIKVKDWTETDRMNYLQFANSVGWLDPNELYIEFGYGKFLQYDEQMRRLEDNQIKGSLPTNSILFERRYYDHWHRMTVFFSRFTTCKM